MSDAVTFEALAKVNVNEHIEKKNGLSYLSWAWAVDYMTRLDPTATWEYREWDGKPFLTLPDGSCMVYCTVTFGGKQRTCHLPVMDYKNKAIQNPDAFQVNTAMQRCLVKAIALHGLGLYIYAGEDLPKEEADAKEKDPGTKLAGEVAGARITPTAGAKGNVSPEQQARLQKVASTVTDWLNDGSVADAAAVIDETEMDADEAVYFWTLFGSKERTALKAEGKARRVRAQQSTLQREEATQP